MYGEKEIIGKTPLNQWVKDYNPVSAYVLTHDIIPRDSEGLWKVLLNVIYALKNINFFYRLNYVLCYLVLSTSGTSIKTYKEIKPITALTVFFFCQRLFRALCTVF